MTWQEVVLTIALMAAICFVVRTLLRHSQYQTYYETRAKLRHRALALEERKFEAWRQTQPQVLRRRSQPAMNASKSTN